MNEEKGARKTTILLLCGIFLTLLIVLGLLFMFVFRPMLKYNRAQSLLDKGEYDSAYELFDELGGYKDSSTMMKEVRYQEAIELYEDGEYEDAYKILEKLKNYKESQTLKKKIRYQEAVSLYEKRDYSSAYAIFSELGDYSDALTYAEKANIKDILSNAEIKDTIIFGSYEQNNFTSDGKEPVEWRVLDKRGDDLLLISRYALDNQQYNSSRQYVNWENCRLRTWLNYNFYENAFSETEREFILTTDVSADQNPYYPRVYQGYNTQDKVFLLSVDEAQRYFSSDADRQCGVTDYALSLGTFMNANGKCWWWLRTNGHDDMYACGVRATGGFNDAGSIVDNPDGGIRPAIWVSIEP